MGLEVLRVPSGFDWPINMIWPGRMIGVCNDMDKYINQDNKYDSCELCKKWGRLSGLMKADEDGCPNLPYTDPPKGEAYQLWCTTTEGHPMSPAFDTPEELAQWLFDNEVSSFGSSTESYETWLKFIKGPGWAPSMVAGPAGIHSGVAEISAQQNKESS